jgi:hypothetical protein
MVDFYKGIVDHLFRLGVNVMYHEAIYLVVQHVLKTYGSAGQFFSQQVFLCIRNVRSLAWDNNAIGQHESIFS